VDAEAAARAVLAGQATAVPKTGSHLVEMVRCLRVARATAIKARTQAANALRALVVTAPVELREQLRELPTGRLASTAARLRPGPILTTTAATKLALRQLGQRYQALDAELAALDAELDRLTAQAAPRLRQLCGVGPEIAGHCWSPPGTTRSGCVARPRSPCCVASCRSRPRRARRCGIA